MSFENIPTSGGVAKQIARVATSAALPVGVPEGSIRYVDDEDILYTYDGGSWTPVGGGSGGGDVTGPSSSADNAVVRFNGTTGKIIQNSVVTIADTTGDMAGVGDISCEEVTSSTLTANRAIVSGGSKQISSSVTTATEIGYVNGVTSSIQTQLDTKISGPGSSVDGEIVLFDGATGNLLKSAMGSGVVHATSGVYSTAAVNLETEVGGVLPIANGGTNSSIALNDDRIIQSSSGAMVEAAAITAARALISNASGIPTHSVTTATELGYVSGVTSSIQTQLNAKGPGDVVGPGSSTDNALARFDSTTGKLLQNTSTFTIDDDGKMVVTAMLDDASGSETGLQYTYTTNKAAGSDTGIMVNFVDTASPGTSNILDVQVNATSILLLRAGVLDFPLQTLNVSNVNQLSLATFRHHTANTTVTFQGRISTGGVGNVFGVRFDNQGVGNMTPTAGTVGYAQFGPNFGANASQFAPTSGSANYISSDFTGIVNTTGTYSGGNTTGIRMSMRYTSTTGTSVNRLLDVGTNNGSAHTSRFVVDSVGKVGIGVTTTLAAMLEIQADTSTTIGEIIRAAASVSVNIQEWQSSASAVLASITSGGTFNSASFTASRAVVTDSSKNLVTIATTSTELGYVNGVTSAIQTQIDARLCPSTTVNVSSDVTLTNKAIHFVDTGAARTLTLPAPSTSLYIVVKDSTGGAAGNNITINPASGLIDGAASLAIATNYGSTTLCSNGTNYFTI